MDNRVVALVVGVALVVAYTRQIPQRIWSIIVRGQRDTLTSLLPDNVMTPGARPNNYSDNTPGSPGNTTGGTSNGTLPGMGLGSGAQQGGAAIAQIIQQHLLALQNPGVDPQLDSLIAHLPATNDARQQGWIGNFKSCYGAGGSVSSCAAQATQNLGWSPFG